MKRITYCLHQYNFTFIKILALFGWLVASQPTVFFSHTSSAPATSQPNEAIIYELQQQEVAS
jgi:hypothetical protein